MKAIIVIAVIKIAVVGGAVFPPLQGMIADSKGVQLSYLIPCFCVVLVVVYGMFCARRVDAGKEVSVLTDAERV